jgi:hypothetical protein
MPGVSRCGAHAQRAGAWRAGSMRQDMTDAQVCGGADGRGGCWWCKGSSAAKAGWSFTGALAHDRPTKGELTDADERRFAVQYAADCAFIFSRPTPSSKMLVGSVAPRARTSMVLQRRRRASAALLVPACAGVCVCPATEHRPHLTTWPCRRPCWRRGAQASDPLRWAATGGGNGAGAGGGAHVRLYVSLA